MRRCNATNWRCARRKKWRDETADEAARTLIVLLVLLVLVLAIGWVCDRTKAERRLSGPVLPQRSFETYWVGRVTPCAPQTGIGSANGAHGDAPYRLAWHWRTRTRTNQPGKSNWNREIREPRENKTDWRKRWIHPTGERAFQFNSFPFAYLACFAV